MSKSPPIYVTRPYLPPLAEVLPLLEGIWGRRLVTNNGPLHQQLEERLVQFLGVQQVSLVANGMLGLELALEAAAPSGEVISTPYSFVATTHAILRAGLTPVFVDVRPDDLNIDARLIEEAITPATGAIVAVHCYGNPCEVEAIEEIARKYQLKVIYDAAHAFGVRHKDRGLLSWGDLSVLSFHGTKMFNTFEGGAVCTQDEELRGTVDCLRNFGILDEVTVAAPGSNGKMSEFNAALGLVQLKHVEQIRADRAAVDRRYRAALAGIDGITPLPLPAETEPNYSYFPVLVSEAFPLSRDALYEALKSEGVFTRRYFHPLLANMPMYRDLPSATPANLPIATRAAEQILCLPIYPDLSEADQMRVVDGIQRRGR